MAEFPQADLASHSKTQEAAVGASAATAGDRRNGMDTSQLTPQDWEILQRESPHLPHIFESETRPAWQSNEQDVAAQVSAAMVGGGPDLANDRLFEGLEEYFDDRALLQNFNREQDIYDDIVRTATTYPYNEQARDSEKERARKQRQQRMAKRREKRQKSKLTF